jgi:hypothetical protein
MASLGIDVLFLVRQDGAIAALTFLPLLLVGAVSPKRKWLFPLGLSCSLGGWLALVVFSTLTLGMITRPWPAIPYRPLHIGPSVFALIENGVVLGVTLWVPAAVVYIGLRYLAENLVVIRLGRSAAIAAFLTYTVVATPWAWLVSMEDTFAAPGFTRARWSDVEVGMTRTDVEKVLGPPIRDPHTLSFARDQGADCWVSNFSAGYFACLWFRSDRVERKHVWYSD